MMRIKTSGSTRTKSESFNDLSSPGTKTPTLVARLMGLDLLPDSQSTSSSSSSSLSTPNKKSHSSHHSKQNIKITKHRHSTDSVIRSLPETPYEKKSNVVEHRLSLQINKENISEDLETPRFSFSKWKFDENNSRSPSHYAKQIVKQVKESVSRRKVGVDITNTVKNREKSKEDFVEQFKLKKVLKPLDESNQGKHSNASNSPRLSRFNDTNQKHSSPKDQIQNTRKVLKQSSPPPVVNIEAQVSRVSKTKTQDLSEKEMMMKDKKTFPKCKKTPHGNLSPKLNKTPQTSIRNKQEESFIMRSTSTTRANDIKTKTKRTHPLSTNLLNNNVPNLLHVKTDPSPPATKIPQKQVCDNFQEVKKGSQLFSCPPQKSKQEASHTLVNDESESNGGFTGTGDDNEGLEYEYITTILSRTGIHRATLPNLHFQWFSSTHPLDPSLFHRLELYPTIPNNHKDTNFTKKNHLGPRCNRRLLFDLVDEVLYEILIKPNCERGLLLLETVWKRARSFPRAKCNDLDDIDGLIEMKDVMDKTKEEEKEGEKLVAEIEGKIMEMLVYETLTVMVGGV
ncbi:uncharacterized protein [Cicer arietinum]|uniref:Uncharacterized protein LOC101515221 n=1 Tax=Cicer arietinum TaxID=3827 RepID=A0A1S2XYQ0_CICAR|nr:uncharacterized protein LOC101515221 [Cicer arietinum]